jgi:ketol-acid reductoisomerase
VSQRLASATVAILGYGHQGEAQALNLRDSGLEVIVGARAGGAAEARARHAGFTALALPEATRRAQVVAVLIPDEAVAAAWAQIEPALRPDTGIVFAHGFNLVYSDLRFPAGADVVLVSPTAPGRVLRACFQRGERLPAYLAAHRDARGEAWALAEAYAGRLGLGPLLRTTAREETEVDLFGEQAVLCGGMNALVTLAFETLVERGYAPEMAYLECVHQLTYLAELLHERGVSGMRREISGTALYGDLTRGPRVVGEQSRAAMREALEQIRSGAFAREWGAEVAAGRKRFEALVRAGAGHAIEAARRAALGEVGEPPGEPAGEPPGEPPAEPPGEVPRGGRPTSI